MGPQDPDGGCLTLFQREGRLASRWVLGGSVSELSLRRWVGVRQAEEGSSCRLGDAAEGLSGRN